VAGWTFLTHHARVLLLVAHDPGVRPRDIAASLNITERGAFGIIITDLAEASSARWLSVAGAGSAERSGGYCWPG
jgi:hypothetical protein